MKLRRILLAALALAGVLAWLAVRWIGYDLDGDGTPDSIALGRRQGHLFISSEGRGQPGLPTARVYDVPVAYVHILVGKAFGWDRTWKVEGRDDKTLSTSLLRRADRVRFTVSVEKWRGLAVARVRIPSPGLSPSARRALQVQAFRSIEDLVFYGIPRPTTVQGFPSADGSADSAFR